MFIIFNRNIYSFMWSNLSFFFVRFLLVRSLLNKHFFCTMTFYNFLLWQACEIISLLKELWPEGSDIRRVLCVTSCSLTLRVYHNFLENRKKTTSGQETNIQQVRLLLLYCETPLLSTFEILLIFIYHFFHLVLIYFPNLFIYTSKKREKSRFCLLKKHLLCHYKI